MNDPFKEIREALYEAERLKRACERSANDMAMLLKGNLRSVSGWNVKDLKKELRDFNMRTMKWKP